MNLPKTLFQPILDGIEDLEKQWSEVMLNKSSAAPACSSTSCFFPILSADTPALSLEGEPSVAPHFSPLPSCRAPLERVAPLPSHLYEIAMSIPSSAVASTASESPTDPQAESSPALPDPLSGFAPPHRLALSEDEGAFPSHCQLTVVRADVNRSLWTLYGEGPVPEYSRETERGYMRRHLACLLLRLHYHSRPTAHYTQGVHDLVAHVMFLICSFREKVLHTETPEVAASKLSERLELVLSFSQSLMRSLWKPFVLPHLDEAEGMVCALQTMIAAEDPNFARSLDRLGQLQRPHYTLQWILTWYMASLSCVSSKMRLLLFFSTSQNAFTPVYCSAALLLGASPAFQTYLRSITDGRSGLELSGPVFQFLSALPSRCLEPRDSDDTSQLLLNTSRSPSLTPAEENQSLMKVEQLLKRTASLQENYRVERMTLNYKQAKEIDRKCRRSRLSHFLGLFYFVSRLLFSCDGASQVASAHVSEAVRRFCLDVESLRTAKGGETVEKQLVIHRFTRTERAEEQYRKRKLIRVLIVGLSMSLAAYLTQSYLSPLNARLQQQLHYFRYG